MKRFIIFLSLLLTTNLASAETIKIDGYISLENMSDHSGVSVNFERIAPSALTDSAFSNSAGYYSINLEKGIYNVKFSKPDYLNYSMENNSFYSNSTLENITLYTKRTFIDVPSVMPSIQSAINASSDGDTVFVAPGKYIENINFNGKKITLASYFLTTNDTTYISQTIIDGNQSGHVVEFSSGEDSTAVLCGFTITNGKHNDRGGGIFCNNSSPYLKNLIITNNSSGYGGGFFCETSNCKMENIYFSNNVGTTYGGAIHCRFANMVLRNILINKNTGGGLYIHGGILSIINTTICFNEGGYRGGGIFWNGYDINNKLILKNCIITNNSEYGIYLEEGTPDITHSLFKDNQNGNFYNCGNFIGKNVIINANGDSCDVYNNIQFDPQFVDPINNDFRLRNYSPSIGAGTSDGAPLNDINGFLRGSPPDIGVYENALNKPAVKPSITIVSPNGGENWFAETTQTISWSSVNVDNVKIEYSIDKGSKWTTITENTTSNSSYSWKIPDVSSSNCLIRVSDSVYKDITDLSDKVFKISPQPTITVTSPNGGEKWGIGTNQKITWTIVNVSKVTIEYSDDDGINWTTITSNLDAASGSYTWTVPEIESKNCLIRIKDASNSQVSDKSDAVFTILPPPSITITTPNGGEKWYAGSVNEIKWSSENVSKVKIEYSLNNGVSWIELVSNIAGLTGHYSWTLPDTVSTKCYVRITDISNSAIKDQSNGAFEIKKLSPPVNFTASDVPNDNGHQIQLTWTLSPDDGIIDGYRIYRSRISKFTTPVVDIQTIESIDELIEKEQVSTILIAKIPRGEINYTDNSVPLNGIEYYYWIEAYRGESASAKTQSGKITSVDKENPATYIVNAPFPNPFNPVTTISYSVPKQVYVSLSIYSLSGQKITSLIEGVVEAGKHEVIFDGSKLASGTYFYRFESPGFVKSGKMLLVK